MLVPVEARCLILTCGNPLRGDDGVGPWLATWAQDRFRDDPSIHIIYRQQWTPELAHDISGVDCVIFVDASNDAAPGAVQFCPVKPARDIAGLATHHLDAPQLLALCKHLYDHTPCTSLLLTIGIGSTDLGETFSKPVHDALQQACILLEKAAMHPHDVTALSFLTDSATSA
jgi:hydrogenase maturation protease